MEAAAEELEVVGDGDERSGCDEDEQPEARVDRRADADSRRRGERRGRERHEHIRADPCLQRSPAQLVERVRRDAHPEEERQQRQPEDARPPTRGDRCADGDVREMPCRVRRVQQRDVVTPAAGCKRVERGTRRFVHARRPHVTMPPPRLSRLERTSRIPASYQSSSRRSSG